MNGLLVKETKERGLGVFATQHFEKGDLIECFRVLVVPKSEILIGSIFSVMRNYVIEWSNKLAVPTGYGCFYNHSYKPNAIHKKHLDIDEVHLHALIDIAPNEEITFNYGGFPDYKESLWFEVKDA